MVNGNKKRKNNRNNKKNKLKRANQAVQNTQNLVNNETEKDNQTLDDEFLLEQQPKPHMPEDYSDAEDEPKRKKKKKQPIHTESSDKKGKKSIRQMKREKHAQRLAEEVAASKDQLKSQCVSYLSQWKHDRQNWKFMKAKQVWLYKNKFSSYLLPDSSWPVFLEYFESAKGNIRNLLLEDANKIIKQMDEWTESQNVTKTVNKGDNESEEGEQDSNAGPKKPDDIAYKRARDLIQCLQE